MPIIAIFRVKKESDSTTTFDGNEIEEVIKGVMVAVEGSNFSYLDNVTSDIVEDLASEKETIPEVKIIQDVTKETLIKQGHNLVTEVYKEQKEPSKTTKNVTVEVGSTIEEYLSKSDWRVNANANSGYSLGGLILNTSGKVIANYWLSYVYPKEVGDLHRNGDYHIHDLDMFSGYYAGWSLRQLLGVGFNGLPNRLDSAPPKNLPSGSKSND